ncbi:MAG: response regulator [Deltaproteobacteria bacterium]|nr:response regulator [Deltaproteobacteria bacterium]
MGERILLIDDEVDFLETLSERMRTRGMDVTTSTSAEEALAKVEEQSFDAVVLDLMMPGMDGLQALKIMKEKKPELQIILLTGHATVQKGVEAIKLGASEFLEKPANIEVLTEKIKKAQAQKMILVEKQAEEKIKRIMTDKPW